MNNKKEYKVNLKVLALLVHEAEKPTFAEKFIKDYPNMSLEAARPTNFLDTHIAGYIEGVRFVLDCLGIEYNE